MKLSLAGKAFIVYQVLLSTLWFFISIWGGSSKALMNILNILRNYLWLGEKTKSLYPGGLVCFL